jgi:small conductance mechanosensitive channel
MEQLRSFFTDPQFALEYALPWAGKIVAALAIYIVGRWIAKAIIRGIRRVMASRNVDQTLTEFLCRLLNTVFLIVIIIAALDHLGVDTTSVLAIFATAGLAVGLAMKDSLSSFAAGVMLVMFRPFKAGDFIEAGGHAGVVEEIKIFSTLMHTPDNREITIPNSQIYGSSIINFSARDTRRIDLVIGIGYDDDIKKAQALITEILQQDSRILEDPAPSVTVAELAESSVNFAVRPWVKSADYWSVRSDLLQGIKSSFDSNGVSIPYPQRDVHLIQQSG